MPGDTARTSQGLSGGRVKALGVAVARLEAFRGQVVEELDARSSEIDTLTARMAILAKVSELFRALMDKLVLGYVKSIEEIVTEGLQAIFQDQELAFEAEATQRYNKIAIDFFITQEGGENRLPIRGHPLTSFGGGPTSIASFILRVLAMLRLKLHPFLALDETLSAVSDEYVDQTGQFLKQFAESTGISILLVTHKQAFTDHATVAYTGSESVLEDGSRKLDLNLVRG